MTVERRSSHRVRADLQELAAPVTAELEARRVRAATAAPNGLAAPLLAFPAIYFLLTCACWLFDVDSRLPWFALLPLTLILPLIRIFLRRASARAQRVRDVDALALLDAELQLADRLSAAHEFSGEEAPDGFMLAAMHDADQRVRAARGRLPADQARGPQRASPLWFAAAAASLLLYMAAQFTPAVGLSADVVDAGPVHAAVDVAPRDDRDDRDEVTRPEQRRPQPDPRVRRRAQQDPGESAPSEDESPTDARRRGRNPMGSGRSAEARTAAGGGSERGQPSNQAQSTKGGKARKPKEKKQDKPREDGDERAEEAKKPPQESGSTQGRGSGKGSSKSPTASPWSAKDEVVTDEEEDLEEDEEVDDESDESKARGGVQPNLRQRKPPVNRDLQISMGNGQPSDDANGRGGPGGPKKQRGVAQLVLGVTFPDHVSAKPNPGISKITQERIEPQAQQGDLISGEDRGERAASMGHMTRSPLSPWMQELVRSFYLSLREEGGPQ